MNTTPFDPTWYLSSRRAQVANVPSLLSVLSTSHGDIHPVSVELTSATAMLDSATSSIEPKKGSVAAPESCRV